MKACERILIISNNVLSMTSNNGKTVYSLFEEYPKEYLFQLYTRDEKATIKIGGYYRITSKDMIKGRFCPKKRGHSIYVKDSAKENEIQIIKNSKIKRTSLSCLIRELLWFGGWKSKQLDEWLVRVNPDSIFFVAGDTLYSYSICDYISRYTGASINVYVTDDYIGKRSNENFFDVVKRKLTYKCMEKTLRKTKSFFTISEKMNREYKCIFNKESMTVFNVADCLKMDIDGSNKQNLLLVYAGSVHNGRAELLMKIARIIEQINYKNKTRVFLEIYSGKEISSELENAMCVDGASRFCGSIGKMDLKRKLNEADILVFVESFDKSLAEKTRLSLSTKISEYLSVGKPILAVGPKYVGSMEYLSTAAVCAYSDDEVENCLVSLVENNDVRKEYGMKAFAQYEIMGTSHEIRKKFIQELCRA